VGREQPPKVNRLCVYIRTTVGIGIHISENKTLRNVFTPRLYLRPILRHADDNNAPNFRATQVEGGHFLEVRDNETISKR